MKKQSKILAFVLSLFTALPVSAETIKIGDYIQMGKYYGETILWRCVDIDENGPLMLSDKILCLKPFDARTSSNDTTGSHSRASGRADFGSDYWDDSNMRSWLNSFGSAGNIVWLCGNPPTESAVWSGYNDYANEAGFLTNFTDDELKAVKTVTQKSIVSYPEYKNGIYTMGSERHSWEREVDKVVQNYDSAYAEAVTDKMFLLDVKQINEIYNNGDVLGNDYYIAQPTAQCVAKSEYKYEGNLETGKNWYYWLRTPVSAYHDVRYVCADGSIYDNNAYTGSLGVRPAFYLRQLSYRAKSGKGTVTEPYVADGLAFSEYCVKFSGYKKTDEKYMISSIGGNNTEEKVSCVFYSAVFTSDGRIKACGKIKEDIAANDDTDIEIPVACPIEKGDVIKTFMWSEESEPLTRETVMNVN